MTSKSSMDVQKSCQIYSSHGEEISRSPGGKISSGASSTVKYHSLENIMGGRDDSKLPRSSSTVAILGLHKTRNT